MNLLNLNQNQSATLVRGKIAGKLPISRLGENTQISFQQNRDIAYNPHIILLWLNQIIEIDVLT